MNRAMTRPSQHLIALGKRYPTAWPAYDFYRSEQGKQLPHWPDYVYSPRAVAYTYLAKTTPLKRLVGVEKFNLLLDVNRLTALAAWRVTQGIYRFDSTLFTALMDTPATGDLPCQLLRCLPEWCVYIETHHS